MTSIMSQPDPAEHDAAEEQNGKDEGGLGRKGRTEHRIAEAEAGEDVGPGAAAAAIEEADCSEGAGNQADGCGSCGGSRSCRRGLGHSRAAMMLVE